MATASACAELSATLNKSGNRLWLTKSKALCFLVTQGPEDPELATVPFVMATTALALGKDVLMGFQTNGAFLMRKGMADHVAASGFPTLTDLMQIYIEGGGKMYVCGPCAEARKITQEDLFEGACGRCG